jgi:hypothetical protein
MNHAMLNQSKPNDSKSNDSKSKYSKLNYSKPNYGHFERSEKSLFVCDFFWRPQRDRT